MALVGGTGIGQLVTLGVMSVLGRLYDEEAFAVMASVSVLASLAIPLVHGRYFLAIPQAEDDASVDGLYVLGVGLSFAVVLPITLVAGWAADGPFVEQRPLLAIGLAAALALAASVTECSTYWLARKDSMAVVSGVVAARAVGIGLVQFALVRFGELGIVVGAALGQVVAAGFLFSRVMARGFRWSPRGGWARLRGLAHRYRMYPLYSVPQGLLAALYWNIVPILLMRMNHEEALASYWVAWKYLSAPLLLLSGSYRRAAMTTYAQRSEAAAVATARKHGAGFLAVGLLLALVLWTQGDLLLHVLLGPGWTEAATFIGLLAVGMLADWALVPVMTALQARGKVRGLLAWELVAVTVAFAACHWAMARSGAQAGLEAFIATTLVVRGAFVLIGLSLLRPKG